MASLLQHVDFQIWLTLGALLCALVLLVLEITSADVALLGALALVVLADVISINEALKGFANPTLLALGSLYIVVAALKQTGALVRAGQYLLGQTKKVRRVVARLIVPVSVGSAFLNNTPIVAMGIPAIQTWCEEHDVHVSSLLIPLSYASILGGMCTLMGTSTNLVSHGLLQSQGLKGLGFFELSAVGIPCILVGWLYLVFVAPLLLDRTPTDQREESPDESPDREVVELEIVEGSELDGAPVAGAGLEELPGLVLNRIERDGRGISPVDPDETLEVGDKLYYTPEESGESDFQLEDFPGLKLAIQSAEEIEEHEENAISSSREEHTVAVKEGSDFIGETIDSANLRDRFNVVVEDVRRGGESVDEPVEDVTLRAGDTLVLDTGEGFREAFEHSSEFFVTSGYEENEQEEATAQTDRETLEMAGTLIVLVGIVAMATTQVLDIAVAALVGACVVIFAGIIRPAKARSAVDWQVLIVIGAALGMGEAMQVSGAASMIGDTIVGVTKPWGSSAMLAGVIVGTAVLTELITNNGAVALFFPICVSIASAKGIDPRPLIIGMTVAGSMSMSTPLGYQTNLMVYSAGGLSLLRFFPRWLSSPSDPRHCSDALHPADLVVLRGPGAFCKRLPDP